MFSVQPQLCKSSVLVKDDTSGVTTLLPGIGSTPAMASVGAQGHSSAQSDFTATELSVSRWELMLSVRCQVELSGPGERIPLFVKAPVIVTPHLLPQGGMGQEGF